MYCRQWRLKYVLTSWIIVEWNLEHNHNNIPIIKFSIWEQNNKLQLLISQFYHFNIQQWCSINRYKYTSRMITSRTIKVNKCNESMYIIFSQFYHSISEIFHKEWNRDSWLTKFQEWNAKRSKFHLNYNTINYYQLLFHHILQTICEIQFCSSYL